MAKRSAESHRLFLGTNEGHFASLNEGIHWTRSGNGLPAAPLQDWLHVDTFLLVSLKQGGIFCSQDEGMNWSRIDGDAERGRTAGFVQTAPGRVLVGSQREGVLKLELDSRQ